jgi:hypothetical protein
MKIRRLIAVAIVSIGLGGLAASCSDNSTSGGGDPVATAATGAEATTIGTNPFIPDDVNIGDCLSSLPRPGCGTEASSSGATLITFGVLAAGLAFIGWRIGRGVRQRDAGRSPAEPPGR